MTRVILFVVSVFAAVAGLSASADAAHRHRGHHYGSHARHYHARVHRDHKVYAHEVSHSRVPAIVADEEDLFAISVPARQIQSVPVLRVASSAAENFRGLVTDLIAMGYRVGSPGCLSSGHMAHSKHHWGGACDLFDQYARDKTRLPQPSPQEQIRVASAHGLTSGCQWRDRDCGHFEVPTGGTRTYSVAHRRTGQARNYASLWGAYARHAVLYTRHWRHYRRSWWS